MDSRFSPLVTVAFAHSYFSDEKLKVFRVLPAKETEWLLAQHDLLLKTQENRFVICFNSLVYGTSRSREQVCDHDIVLRFYILNSDPYFLQYTEALDAYVPGKNLLQFSNTHGNEKLHPGEFADNDIVVTDETVQKDTAFFPVKPFAVMSLHLKQLTAALYTVQFATRQTYWRYILSTSFLQQLEKPAIVGKQSKAVFKGPEWITLPDNRKALCFVSGEKIAFHEIPNRDWQLVEQYDEVTGRFKVVKKILPAPDITHLSVIDTSVDTASLRSYSEIIL
ncbi:hypothetical protein SAMN05421788_10652 [Filimonas lacunae]|uniref:Uncharacterized protein n=1 Tax=Filimonas lacunae TaxID=477680 RepID=A0A173MEW8_9BACT|nr:hypothetical protein [Filimonas lacunae]BAV05978.1 hypothetical protein FLA_1993 [Filimonas lacunae]SIT24018.1 hypothetical protein SAMN05421788_10652 [Filimonas lacunae]